LRLPGIPEASARALISGVPNIYWPEICTMQRVCRGQQPPVRAGVTIFDKENMLVQFSFERYRYLLGK
jgi:hypothetical protein